MVILEGIRSLRRTHLKHRHYEVASGREEAREQSDNDASPGLPDVRKPASRKDAGSATVAQLVPERRAVIVIDAFVFCTIRPVPFGITIKSGSAFQFVLGDSSAVAAH